MSFQENESEEKTQIHCINCQRKTNHLVVRRVVTTGYEIFRTYSDGSDETIDWSDDYQIIQCQGCEGISFRHLHWFSEQFHPEINQDGKTERLYPQRSINALVAANFLNAPVELQRIYRETIDAFNYESFTLCAGGLRALVKGICADQKIIDGPSKKLDAEGNPKRNTNLEGKIAGLHEKGILTKTQADQLHEHRFLGNEALHDLQQPSTTELHLAIDIIEHTLKTLYEIPEKTKLLKISKAKRTGDTGQPEVIDQIPSDQGTV